MAQISKPYSFSAGATILAAEHNDNFDTIYSEFNGNIDNSNIKANAAIVDTKLAQITTASKVSTSALTGQILDASLGGAVKTGTNSTITSITGLTTPLAVNQGGTSQVTANTAFNALAPAQATNSGKYLTTNGTDTSWATLSVTTFSNLAFCVSNLEKMVGDTYVEKYWGKMLKHTGISSIMPHARISSENTSYIAKCKFDVGGLNTEITTTASSATWSSTTALDISSLTNGITYNITVSLNNGTENRSTTCYAFTALGN